MWQEAGMDVVRAENCSDGLRLRSNASSGDGTESWIEFFWFKIEQAFRFWLCFPLQEHFPAQYVEGT